jgi:hypothetical protein
LFLVFWSKFAQNKNIYKFFQEKIIFRMCGAP